MEVNFYDEKVWIASLLAKQYHKGVGKEKIFRMWCGWWPNDFLDDNGKPLAIYNHKICIKEGKKKRRENGLKIATEKNDLFNDIYEKVTYNIQNLTLPEIRRCRMMAAKKNDIPKDLERQARKKGVRIRKSFVKDHPLRVSGYMIVQADNLKNVVAGKKYDLTLKDVREILKGIDKK